MYTPNTNVKPFGHEDKVALIFVNSYDGTSYSLGQPVINDGMMTYDRLKAKGYTPFMYHDTTINQFMSILLKFLKQTFELVVYFSGHGSRAKDRNGDEDDGLDECLVLMDGLLSDDIISAMLKLHRNKSLTLIADCCHSGTIFDTKSILTISACHDNETAKQTGSHKGQGVFTYYFWKYIDQCHDIDELISMMNTKLCKYDQKACSNKNKTLPLW